MAAAEINERKRNGNDDKREHPAQQSPVGICFGEEANRKKKCGAKKYKRDWNRGCSCRRRSGSVPPAFPEQVKREQWNDQTVIVLRIEPPLGFQLIDELEPKQAEENNRDQPACSLD